VQEIFRTGKKDMQVEHMEQVSRLKRETAQSYVYISASNNIWSRKIEAQELIRKGEKDMREVFDTFNKNVSRLDHNNAQS
jgi:predicted transcriptional regulator